MPINTKIEQGKFHHHFQPVYNLCNWKIEGYEALLRSKVYPSPKQAFKVAAQDNILYELDISSIYNGIYYHKKANFNKKAGRLYINVFLSTVLNPAFPSFLTFLREKFPNERDTVFEINEEEKHADLTQICEAHRLIQEVGFKTSFVNFWKNCLSIEEMKEINPDNIKLHGSFTNGLDQSVKKQEIVALIKQYCAENNIRLIVQGIESPAELAIARILNIPFGQGYILAKPQSLETQHDWMRLPQLEKESLYTFYRI